MKHILSLAAVFGWFGTGFVAGAWTMMEGAFARAHETPPAHARALCLLGLAWGLAIALGLSGITKLFRRNKENDAQVH